MRSQAEVSAARRPRFLMIVVMLTVAGGITLANLSSEPVTGELIKKIVSKPERAYGWPFTWYWREASTVPSSIPILGGSTTRPVLEWPVARYNANGLIANLAVWLALLAASAVVCQRLPRRYSARNHWRPRATTLLVLLAVVVPTVLANMTFEISALSPTDSAPNDPWRACGKASFGWPLVWNWYVVAPSDNLFGWDFSAARLAGNTAIWLAMLGAVAIPIDWFFRRYRPRLRFSVRTMLAATAVIAILCAWGASIWKRARDQDELVASAVHFNSSFRVERWGPKWLGVVVPDRYRRKLVAASINIGGWPEEEEEVGPDASLEEMQDVEASEGQTADEASDPDDEFTPQGVDRRDEELLRRLARLPALRFLAIQCGMLTPAMTDSLADMQQLRTLSVGMEFVGWPNWRADFGWLGNLRQLERLSLEGIGSDDLGRLTNLKRLNLLTLDLTDCEQDKAEMDKRLTAIGKLTQLRRIRLTGFPGGRIAHLNSLTNLKSLTIEFDSPGDGPQQIHEFFVAIGGLTQLEQLQLSLAKELQIHPQDVMCLGALKNLKSLRLSIACDTSGSQACVVAIAALIHLRRLWLDGDLAGADLAGLAPLESLEELTSDHRMATPAAIKSLVALRHLKAVHIEGLDFALATTTTGAGEVRRALEALQQSHPRIVVDSDYHGRTMAAYNEDSPAISVEPFYQRGTDLDSVLGVVPMGP